ncbi:serine/threonine-protein kinase [Rudaeicoccus suwonensis]|uniref:non-specific serine/threonine protein kinase n=1 Tax=Rudaeicoccus suwonensis TaxID=657409 RepID=A0A561E459_9MICO|nr:serine/threonine-protein kinase [Rudaeicoccus suwonensis]TWE10406.1 serine/threonine protein kinase [Rudaeicoccus suwonensis]
MSRQGDQLGGRYVLTDRIAAGGMGEVWQAKDEILGRTVAIKLLKEGLTDEEGFTERFRNEARLSAALTHGNIAQVYDYGEDGALAYLVMEYVPGKPLSKIISERRALSPVDTVGLMHQAASALHAAHRAGLIHRDVKPANMLVTPDGVVKLTDFGIARAVGSVAMTKTGEVMGTAQYLAPEAAMGQETTALTDVYSLAVVTYEMLGGRRPFNADSAVALALQHVNDAPPPLPSTVPPPVRAVVHVGLEKDPSQRPNSAFEFGRALRQAISDSEQMGYDVHSLPPAPQPQAPPGPSGGQPGPQSGGHRLPGRGDHQSGGQQSVAPGSGPQSVAPGSGTLSRHNQVTAPESRAQQRNADTSGAGGGRGLARNKMVLFGGIGALVVVIAIVVIVALTSSSSKPKVPTAPDSGPFSGSIQTYTPKASS